MTGGSLKPLPAPHINFDMRDRQRHTTAGAVGDTEFNPCIRIGRQAMMDMHGRETTAKAEPTQEMQQDNRIATARKADTQTIGRCQAGRKKSTDPRRQIS